MSRTMSFYDLRDALAQPGCAVCRLKVAAAERFLESLIWENVNDPCMRYDIRRAQGFCHEHAWGLVRNGASLGVAIIMRDVLQSVLNTMENAQFQTLPTLSLRRARESLDPRQPAAATAGLAARLAPQVKCPACVQAEKMEAIYSSTLIEHLLGEDGLLTTFEACDGLCLPHFRQALACVRDESIFDALVNAQRTIWERLVGHLSETIRKSDYRFREEPWGEESGAWLRAIAATAGARHKWGGL